MKRITHDDVKNLCFKVIDKTLCSGYDLRMKTTILHRTFNALDGINNKVKCDSLNSVLDDFFKGGKQ